MTRRPKATLAHRLEYLLYRLGESFFRLLSLETVFKLGEFTGRLAHRLSPRYRRLVRRNLRIAYASEKSLAEIDTLTARVFERTGANLLSSIRCAFLSDEQLRQHVTLEGLEHCQAAHEQKHGLILLIPHMGNWEIIAQGPALLDFPVTGGTHYRPLNNPLMNTLIERRRQQRGVRLFAKKSSIHSMSKFLRTGGFLGILADVRAGARGDVESYFGRLTTCSPLPRLLAERSATPFIGLSCHTTAPARWTLRFTPVSGTSTAEAMRQLELSYRAVPEDVFWFQDRWKLPPRHPLSLPGKTLPPTGKKPLRLLDLTPENTPLALTPSPENQVRSDFRIERATLPPSANSQWLATLNDAQPLPFDLIICAPSQLPRVKKLARPLHISVSTPENLHA